jgi:hypothetical protein
MQAKALRKARRALENLILSLEIESFGTARSGPCLKDANGRRIRAS